MLFAHWSCRWLARHSWTRRNSWIKLLWIGMLLTALCSIRSDQFVFAAGPYDRPSGDPHQSRSTVIATQGMVATSHPLAAAVGVDILKAGGNAVDAAIATNAMLGLVEPMSCGIGGDLFVIYWDAKTERLYGLNASGRSPYAINRQVFADRGLDQIPSDGPLSWSVPGCVDGWFALHARFGSKPFAEILGPSIEYGRSGFPVTEIIAGYWAGDESNLAKHPDSSSTFLVNRQGTRRRRCIPQPESRPILRIDC